jgi:gluconolactonase
MTDPPGIGHCNGMTLDLEDRLIVCGQGARHMTRTEHDGTITVLAEGYQGKRFNGPNDVVVHDSGQIYFTDPPWGLPPGRIGKELPVQGVYRIDTGGTLYLEVDDFEHPNGLAFSPDQRTLYIGDDARGHVRAFDVRPDGSLANGRHFADTPLAEGHRPGEGVPDGMKVDSEGHLYLGSVGGVWIFGTDGGPIGIISIPETAANLAWGDADWRTLYITATTSLYRIRLNVPGIPLGKARRR